jgi:sulfoxide reductase catalytic subunit YedY
LIPGIVLLESVGETVMLIKKPGDIPSSEITSKEHFTNRRSFIKEAGLGGAAALTTSFSSCLGKSAETSATGIKLQYEKGPFSIRDEDCTPLEKIINFSNFYEFGLGKGDPARNAGDFRPDPWTVSVEGEVGKPESTYDIDAIVKMHPALEERVYRMRCVEAWSMVIPWIGIPLASVIKALEPTSKAGYVVFETLHDPAQMPGQKDPVLPWPYREALRMDEAMHPLTILAVGVYGETLPKQAGAPIRLVVPWKYGFKSIKSIVKIRFQESTPQTSWNMQAPKEYGFFANVNPEVDHPRWSQATELRVGESQRRKTLLFNGYADQVAHLYSGMDLRNFY